MEQMFLPAGSTADSTQSVGQMFAKYVSPKAQIS